MKINQQHKVILLFLGILLLYISHQDIIYDSDQIAYLSGAKNLLENGKYLVNGKPDWRGVGYGHFLVIPFFLFGANFQTGVYFSIFCALLTLIAVFKIARFHFDQQESLLVILVLFPGFHFWRQSTTLMTEIPALCFLIWGFYFLIQFYQHWKRPAFYLACLHFGLAILLRPVNIFLGIFLVPLLWRKEYRADLILGSMLIGLLLTPQFIYNAVHFGGPLTSGYSKIFKPFDLNYFFESDTVLRRPSFQMMHYLWNIFLKPSGFGIPWLPFLILGIVAGIKKVRQNLLMKMLGAWIISYMLLISFYAYHDERFFVPLLPPLAIFTILGFRNAADWLKQRNLLQTPLFNIRPSWLFGVVWVPAFLVSLTLIQTSINLHANRYAALKWVQENAPPNAGLITSEAYLGRYLTGLETINYSKTWNQQASFPEISEFIESKKKVYVVLPQKRLYIVTPMNATSGYGDIEVWLKRNFEMESTRIFKSKLPRLMNLAFFEEFVKTVNWVAWPQEQFNIWQITRQKKLQITDHPEENKLYFVIPQKFTNTQTLR